MPDALLLPPFSRADDALPLLVLELVLGVSERYGEERWLLTCPSVARCPPVGWFAEWRAVIPRELT